ncbi:MAG: hypothetical protein A2Y77_14010 [Planctomycetes bacterium RBG_13_62_9]|nr:MAG: hypothetical protein A2Y77_14010 [Planctomycetes bacterium RBG_13_62_9]
MWHSAKGQTQTWVEFDFGEVQKVSTICIWNFNDAWHTDQGVRKADISIWTQETGWQKVRDDLPLEQAEGTDDYDEPVLVTLDAVKAQKIRFDDLASLGDAEFVGLSEVQFFGPVGLAAARLYPPDKAEGVGIRDLKLTWIAGDSATSHNVYIGTSPDDLKPLGKVEQTGVTLSQLKSNTPYYWRVDTVQKDGSVTSGGVHRFTTGGLAAWWKLDETAGVNAADSSGNRHDGALQGSPTWQPASGKVAGAMQFDGVDDYVDTGWAGHLPVWTVSAWIRSPAAPKPSGASGPVHCEKNFQIDWDHGNDEFRGAVGVRVGGMWYGAGFGDLKSDTWYHLTATYDGENLKAYRDGTLISDNAGPSGDADAETETLKFGRHASDDKAFFAGSIDNVCVFTYALSADEVKALYSGDEPVAIVDRPAPAVPSLAQSTP